MNQAWMFPGQGSQYPGMGRRLFTEFQLARETLAEASELCGLDLDALRERGPANELMRPAVAEPLIAATQIAYAQCLQLAGIRPAMVGGYSAGEVAAFYAAGVLSRRDALRAAVVRGTVLEGFVDSATRMVNVSRIANHLTEDVIEELQSNSVSDIEIAAWNAPDSMTLVGSSTSIRNLSIELQAQGGIVSDVSVAGPWHTRRLAAASRQIRKQFAELTFQRPDCLLFLSATGSQETEPYRLTSGLAAQVAMPVLWQHVVEHFWLSGTRDVLELGPGRVLLGMLRRNWIDFSSYSVECVESAAGSIAPFKRLLASSTGIHS